MSYIDWRAVEPFIVLTFWLDSTFFLDSFPWLGETILGMRSWSFVDALMFNDHSVCLSLFHSSRYAKLFLLRTNTDIINSRLSRCQRVSLDCCSYSKRLFYLSVYSNSRKDVIRSHQSDIYRCLFHLLDVIHSVVKLTSKHDLHTSIPTSLLFVSPSLCLFLSIEFIPHLYLHRNHKTVHLHRSLQLDLFLVAIIRSSLWQYIVSWSMRYYSIKTSAMIRYFIVKIQRIVNANSLLNSFL